MCFIHHHSDNARGYRTLPKYVPPLRLHESLRSAIQQAIRGETCFSGAEFSRYAGLRGDDAGLHTTASQTAHLVDHQCNQWRDNQHSTALLRADQTQHVVHQERKSLEAEALSKPRGQPHENVAYSVHRLNGLPLFGLQGHRGLQLEGGERVQQSFLEAGGRTTRRASDSHCLLNTCGLRYSDVTLHGRIRNFY